MPGPRAAAVAVLGVLCVVAMASVAAGAAAVGGPTPAGPGPALALQGEEFDRVEFRVTVHQDGSARWTFHYERVLENESEREQFEAFAETFTAEDTRLYTDFRNQSETLAARGAAATGREMAAESFERRAFVTTQLNEVGVVEMSFTWTGFARGEGERLVVGDVFEGGLYIGPGQALVVRAGDGLAFQSVDPPAITSAETLAASETVTWQGEHTFADRHPRVELGPEGAGTQTGGGPGTDGTDGPTTAVAEPGSPLWPVGLVLVVIVAALGAFVYRRRSGGPLVGGRPSGGGSSPTSSAPAVDESALLDDEERITRLLREHGGRMRQSAIVEATGWSKSKVSMVLSEMADEDAVRKLRVGRENIISLPGHEPEAAGSPHDDVE